MNTKADGLPQNGSITERLKRLEQQIAEDDAALVRLGEKIREADRRSKGVFPDVVPVVPET